MLKNKFTLLLTAAALLILNSCSQQEKPKTEHSTTTTVAKETNESGGGQASVAVSKDEDMNALQLAESLDDFSTLVAAIKAAGVQDAVVNTGPLTIFAPLNSAFEKLPKGTVETLVKPENKKKLTMILINHVAPANYPIRQLKKEARKGRKLYMASGNYLEVENKDGEIYVGGVKIIKSVKVSNGWIHVIDDVLVPKE